MRDCNLAMDGPRIVVTRKAGRCQELPVFRATTNALRPFVLGRPPDDRVFPATYNVIDRDLRRLGARVGISRISCHDLRRTFGRLLLYDHKVDVNRILVLYGHRDTAMTLYYIGASSDGLHDAINAFDAAPDRVRQPIPAGV